MKLSEITGALADGKKISLRELERLVRRKERLDGELRSLALAIFQCYTVDKESGLVAPNKRRVSFNLPEGDRPDVDPA